MNGTLGGYRSLVQHVANTLYALFALPVILLDQEQRQVATAGSVEGAAPPAPSGPHQRTSRTGFKAVILAPGEHQVCEGCEKRGCCPLLGELLVPVQSAASTYGSLALVATTPDQYRRIMDDHSLILQVADLLLTAVVAQIEGAALQNEVDRMNVKLQYLVDQAQTGVAITDLNGQMERCNKEFVTAFGLGPEERGRVDLLDRLAESNERVRLKGLTRQVPLQAKRRDRGEVEGTLTPLSFRGQPYAVVWQLKGGRAANGQPSASTGGGKNFTLDDIKGVAPQLVEVKNRARRAASSESTILITGESGTGKEVFARAIHNASGRRAGPFVAINCAAIPEALLESELFGYEEGAFSGARRGGKQGRFELANGGTLFLDEIGDMSPDLQAKLLRVLQQRVIERVGGVAPIPVQVRIVAATNQNLEERIRRGLFREDLYYRLNVIPLSLPPLRERKEDIYILLDFFMKKYALLTGREPKQLTAEAVNALFRYEWPGNVRELENLVEYVMNLEIGQVISLQSLPERVRSAQTEAGRPTLVPLPEGGIMRLDEVIQRSILAAVRHFGLTTDGKRAAARALGISVATLYRRLGEIDSQTENGF